MLNELTIHDWISIIQSGIGLILILLILRWNHLLIKIAKMKSEENKIENYEEYENDYNM